MCSVDMTPSSTGGRMHMGGDVLGAACGGVMGDVMVATVVTISEAD